MIVAFGLLERVTNRPLIRSAGGVVTPSDTASRTASRPGPVSSGFQGCPAFGDGGDRQLNFLKNRVDSADWVPTPFVTVVDLGWPPSAVRRMRDAWSRRDSITVARQEGLPVAVEGYFVAAKQEGPEATNCHGADGSFRDWHLWLAERPGKDRRRSIVVETTPSIRAQHAEWSLTRIRKLVRDSTRVRVSGWLMLDQEHPEQLRKTRGTLWEIHPVMRIEMLREGQWTDLGDGSLATAKELTNHANEPNRSYGERVPAATVRSEHVCERHTRRATSDNPIFSAR